MVSLRRNDAHGAEVFISLLSLIKLTVMEVKWEKLYSDLLVAINRCWSQEPAEADAAACSYRASLAYWHKLKVEFLQRQIYIDSEEIEFFRNVKPQFTSHIEYFLMLNQALLFVPEDKVEQTAYWQQESQRLEKFVEKNEAFIKYYQGRFHYQDRRLFLQRNNNKETPLSNERLYEDAELRCSHDHIVRSLLANELYHDYVQTKLNKLLQTI